VIALDDSELGCTDIVHHAMDTGDHPLTKQKIKNAQQAQKIKFDKFSNPLVTQF